MKSIILKTLELFKNIYRFVTGIVRELLCIKPLQVILTGVSEAPFNAHLVSVEWIQC